MPEARYVRYPVSIQESDKQPVTSHKKQGCMPHKCFAFSGMTIIFISCSQFTTYYSIPVSVFLCVLCGHI